MSIDNSNPTKSFFRISSVIFSYIKCFRNPSNTELEISDKISIKYKSPSLRGADLLVNLVIIFPLTIAFWRGVWQLMDYYSELWSADPWLSISLGYLIPFNLYVFQEPLKTSVLPGQMNIIAFYTISRSRLLLHAFGSVNQWRGLWKLLDQTTGIEPYAVGTSLGIGVLFSHVFKTFGNNITPPLYCCMDQAEFIHHSPLRYESSPKKCKLRYVSDCAFTVTVIGSLIICSWRGLWILLDLYLYPEDEFMSTITSLVCGGFICTTLCVLQPVIHKLQGKVSFKGIPTLIMLEFTYIFGFIGCVCSWRGLWNFYNLYVVFETKNLSEWITTIVGSLGGIVFGCISTIIVRVRPIDRDVTSDWLIASVSLLFGNRDIIEGELK